MTEKLLDFLPTWAHPRFPLVANELRQFYPIDFHIAWISRHIRHLFSFVVTVFVLLSTIVLFGGGYLFGFFLFPVIIVLLPIAFFVSEILYSRVLFRIPSQTSQMIAGEMQRGTWDPLLSTPLPRYQIVLSKFIALLWNAEPALTPILFYRLVLVAFLAVESLTLNDRQKIIAFCLVGLSLALFPLIEIIAFDGMGLFISFIAKSPHNANILNWGFWLTYRFLMAIIFLLLTVEFSAGFLLLLLLCMVLPQWVLLLFWLAPSPELFDVLLSTYVFSPLILGSVCLWLTIRLVQQHH